MTNGRRANVLLLLALGAGCACEQRGVRATEAPDAARAGPRSEELTFESEGVTLSGTAWLPAGSGPHPAMVYVHGSGRVRRGAATRMARHFQAAGIAVLAYDKRGVGASGGVYEGRGNASPENLRLLARDAGAAVRALRARPSIDPDRVGLWGVSQAGWIVPVAAALDRRIAFTVLISGPTVTVGEEAEYSRLTGDSSSGRAGLDPAEVSRRLAERGPRGFDPLPYLRAMTQPGLWLLGSADESIPIPETVAILDALIAAGKPFQYRLFDGADHALRVGGRTVPGYWSVQDRFLKELGVGG